jgi:hypothetical protein
MPAFFMFNYMMAVTSSPCENLIDMSLVTPSVSSLVLPNGEGAQIFGYHLRSKEGRSMDIIRLINIVKKKKLWNQK